MGLFFNCVTGALLVRVSYFHTLTIVMCVCGRISFLKSIEDKSAADFKIFLRKSIRIFYLLIFLMIINAAYEIIGSQRIETTIYYVSLALAYGVYIATIRSLTDPTSNEYSIKLIHCALADVCVIASLYLVHMIYEFVFTLNYLLFLDFFSISIQLSTLYILYQWKSKIQSEQDQLLQSINADHI
jgi:hypothetical protein